LSGGGLVPFFYLSLQVVLTACYQWNAARYDVWASLVRDFLPIMASSVSSERAFSSAGITISKRRNRLNPDIIEALQFLKCLYRRELLFRDEVNTEREIEELGGRALTGDGSGEVGEADEESWDVIIEDSPEDGGFEDHDEDEVFVQQLE
jgi:hypothetical protein